jgi:hypothetical protein
MHQHRTPALLLLLPLLCWGATPTSAVYTGRYFYNFENSAFTPKGHKKCWVLKGDMSRAEIPSKDGYPPWGTADVVIRGILGPVGQFGNLGSCNHVLTVLEVIEVRNKIAK